MNRFSKACLVIIVLLLAIIALHPIVKPQATLAASHYQCLIVTTPNTISMIMQRELDNRVAEG